MTINRPCQRAIQGLHLGSIPFGYQPCWERIDGERRRTCNPEHPGGVHLVKAESDAVRADVPQLFYVTTDGNVVLGRVRIGAVVTGREATVEEVMDSGSTTTRTDTTLESILERLNARNVESILVTTSDGRLVGTLYRSDAEARLSVGRVEVSETSIEESCCCCKD